jgi:5-methylcytosine-specific restriction endonuclease McrA
VTVLRACVTCGTPSRGSYCREHKPKPWATSTRKERLTVSGGAEQTRRKRILARDMGICHVCDQRGADQVDHVVPLAEGGADEEWNLASIHAEPCHRDKTRAEAERARAKVEAGGQPLTRNLPRVAEVADGARLDSQSGGRSEPKTPGSGS